AGLEAPADACGVTTTAPGAAWQAPTRKAARTMADLNQSSIVQTDQLSDRYPAPRGLSGRLAAVDGPALDLVLVEALVQVEPLEQELDHRRTHLRPVLKRQLAQRGCQLRKVADRLGVGAGRDALAYLEHGAVLELRDHAVELGGREVAAEHSAHGAALEPRQDLLLLTFVERLDLDAARGR